MWNSGDRRLGPSAHHRSPTDRAPLSPEPAAGPRKLTGPNYERFIRVRGLLQARYPQIFSWGRPWRSASEIARSLHRGGAADHRFKGIPADLGAPEGLPRRPRARRSPG